MNSKYKELYFHQSSSFPMCLPEFLLAMADDPWLCWYPSRMRVSSLKTELDLYKESEEVEFVCKWQSQLKKIIPLICTCEYIDPEARMEWFDEIQNGNEGAMCALLLALLPSLQTLEFACSWKDFHIRLMVRKIATALCSGEESQALSKLKSLFVINDADLKGEDIGMMAPFAALPAMRHIDGELLVDRHLKDDDVMRSDRCFAEENGEIPLATDSVHWKLASHTCIMNSLQFRGSTIAASSFSALLMHVEGLQRFQYTRAFGNEANGETLAWEPYAVRECLQRYANSTLREVEIVAFGVLDSKFIGSFKGFQVLQRLRVDFEMFFDNAENKMPKLSTMLPISIEKVSFLSTYSAEEEHLRMITMFTDFKGENLPNLRSIVFEHPGSQFCFTGASMRLLSSLLLAQIPLCPALIDPPRSTYDLKVPSGGLFIGVALGVGTRYFRIGKDACKASHDHSVLKLEGFEFTADFLHQPHNFDAVARAVSPFLTSKFLQF